MRQSQTQLYKQHQLVLETAGFKVRVHTPMGHVRLTKRIELVRKSTGAISPRFYTWKQAMTWAETGELPKEKKVKQRDLQGREVVYFSNRRCLIETLPVPKGGKTSWRGVLDSSETSEWFVSKQRSLAWLEERCRV